METTGKDMMTTHEVCELLRVDRTTLWRWRRAGVGPVPVEVGPRALRYRRAEVEAYLREHQGSR
ncbi:MULTISPECIES: helix-turn-helix transcriptional regulator [Kocuria]|nr:MULTISPECIES: helix-turn-helix domain-containing protein [Kocuria]